LIFARTGNTVSSNAIGQKRFTFRQMCRMQIDQMHLTTTLGDFTFWISLSLRPKTETKWLKFGAGVEGKSTQFVRSGKFMKVSYNDSLSD